MTLLGSKVSAVCTSLLGSANAGTSLITSTSVDEVANGDPLVLYGSGFGVAQGEGQLVLTDALLPEDRTIFEDQTIVGWVNDEITITVLQGSLLDGDIYAYVEHDNGHWSEAVSLTLGGMEITGCQLLQANRDFTITGTGFGASQGTGKVRRDSEVGTSLSVVSWSDTEIIATWLNIGPPLDVDIYVINDAGQVDFCETKVVSSVSSTITVGTTSGTTNINHCFSEGGFTDVDGWEFFFASFSKTLDSGLYNGVLVGRTSGAQFQLKEFSCAAPPGPSGDFGQHEPYSGGRYITRVQTFWTFTQRQPTSSGFVDGETVDIFIHP